MAERIACYKYDTNSVTILLQTVYSHLISQTAILHTIRHYSGIRRPLTVTSATFQWLTPSRVHHVQHGVTHPDASQSVSL